MPLLAQTAAPLIRHGSSGCSQNAPVAVGGQAHEKPSDEEGLTRHVPPLPQIPGFIMHTLVILLVALQNVPVKFGGHKQRTILVAKSWKHVPLFRHGFDAHKDINVSHRGPV